MNNNVPSGVRPIVTTNPKYIMIGGAIVVVVLGLVAGWAISGKKAGNSNILQTNSAVNSVTVTKNEAGFADASAFKDTATGTLQVGGIKGEGTYHLDRPGGATKTVYLTSTIVDMSPFVGKKVQVWGQTQSAKYAPWFMDVGRIKVVE
jgi:hypothetical protein